MSTVSLLYSLVGWYPGGVEVSTRGWGSPAADCAPKVRTWRIPPAVKQGTDLSRT